MCHFSWFPAPFGEIYQRLDKFFFFQGKFCTDSSLSKKKKKKLVFTRVEICLSLTLSSKKRRESEMNRHDFPIDLSTTLRPIDSCPSVHPSIPGGISIPPKFAYLISHETFVESRTRYESPSLEKRIVDGIGSSSKIQGITKEKRMYTS